MPSTVSASSRRFAEQAEEATRLPARLRRGITRLTGLTVSVQILVVVGLIFWCVGRYAGGRPLYMLAYGVIAVVVVSKILTRRPPPVQGQRGNTNPRVTEGSDLNLHLTLSAERRVTNLVLEERLPLVFGQHVSLPVALT